MHWCFFVGYFIDFCLHVEPQRLIKTRYPNGAHLVAGIYYTLFRDPGRLRALDTHVKCSSPLGLINGWWDFNDCLTLAFIKTTF